MAYNDPTVNGKATPSNPVGAPSVGGPSPGARDNPGTESYPNQTATSGSNAPQNQPVPAPPVGGTNWTTDPIYQLVLGQQNLAIKQAQSAALTAETQALIAYGDASLALAVTGDQNVANAAAANKASTLAQLVAQNKTNVRNTNDAENKSNLFYSSDRGYQLGLAQQAYLNNSASALSGIQGTLGSISANLLAQQQAAYQNESAAAGDAFNRALANPVGSPAAAGATPPVSGPKNLPPTSPWSAPPTGGTAYQTVKPTTTNHAVAVNAITSTPTEEPNASLNQRRTLQTKTGAGTRL